jgi:hypothetical protein
MQPQWAVDSGLSQAKTRSRDELQADVDKARETAVAHAARLAESASGAGAKMSPWWAEVQQNWHSHVAEVSSDVSPIVVPDLAMAASVPVQYFQSVIPAATCHGACLGHDPLRVVVGDGR